MRWTRMHARAWFGRAALTSCERTTGAQDERCKRGRRSRVVLASVADAKSLRRCGRPNRVRRAGNPRGDGDKKEVVAEESSKETVKTIARGKPGDFRRNRGDYRVLPTIAHGLRVLRAPGFPCALYFGGSIRSNPRVHCTARSRTFVCRGIGEGSRRKLPVSNGCRRATIVAWPPQSVNI
jgi:hypothetical protein